MRMINRLFVVLLAVCPAVCQDMKPSPPSGEIRPLAITERVWVNSHAGDAMLLPLRCDAEGNVYVVFYHFKNPAQEPIYKFDARGAQKAKFLISSDSTFTGRGRGGLEFAVGKDGAVYQLAIGGENYESYIVSYDGNGTIKSKARLDPDFAARQFGVFDSGEFLVTGTPRETEQNLNPHSVFTGIFDATGKLLRKLVMPEDKGYQEGAERGDTQFFEPSRGGGGNFAVERGTVARSSDGNLYLVRSTTPVKVYVISPAGEVVRTFEVTSELAGKHLGAVIENNGRLAFQFLGTSEDTRTAIQVVSSSGEKYATYDASPVGISLACYSQPAHFTFLGVDNGNLQLIAAEAR